MEHTEQDWNRLDVVAKIFPAIMKKTYSSFYRIEIEFKKTLVYEALQHATSQTLKRYPLFQVRLRKGLFWYFFEPHEHPVIIESLRDNKICRYESRLGKHGAPLWRILAQDNRLAIEISHIITDGGGAVHFIRTLLCVYYEYLYGSIADWKDIKKIEEGVQEGELEYAYRKYSVKEKAPKPVRKKAFHYPDIRRTEYHGNRLLLSMEEMRTKAKEYQVTVSEFIVSVHMYVVQRMYRKKLHGNKGRVRDLVLIDLRNYFDTKTLRNFYWFLMPMINFSLGEYSFEEILKKVHSQCQNMTDKREIQRHFSEYISAELDWFNRIVPRPIKDFVLSIVQKEVGEKIITSSVSNLGKMDLPSELERIISHFVLYPVPSQTTGKNLGVIGYGSKLSIGFGSYIDNINLEREMALEFRAMGFEVTFLER